VTTVYDVNKTTSENKMSIEYNEKRQFLKGMSRSSQFASWAPYELVLIDKFDQATISHGQKWRENVYSDVGGPWLMNRTTNQVAPIWINDLTGNGPYYCARATGFNNSASAIPTDAQLNVLGTKAISVVAPTNPSFSLPRAIGELKKDGLPSISGVELWKERTRRAQSAGSEYLNLEFAWKPLISDVHKLARSVIDQHKILEGYYKGRGTKNRRRFLFPPSRDTKVTDGTGFLSPAVPTRNCKAYTSSIDVSSSWFSGCFKYWLPSDESQMNLMASHYEKAKKLLGIRLTPDTLYELTPWSWAADWFANTGDIVTNVSNLGTDGLVMQYGYMMSHSSYEETTSFSYQGKNGFYRQLKETKKRVPASPYGFGLVYDGLSNRQKAITAALGITRVR